jgi:UDP:flavonoid glycosyltransferase YjiC (YdhE family)
MISKIVERGSDVFSSGIIDSSDLVLVPDFAPPFTFSHDSIDYFGASKKFHFVGPTALVKEKKKGRKPLVSAGGNGVQHRNFDDVINVLDKMGYNPIVADGSLEDEEIHDAIARAPFCVVHGGHTTITSSISANTPVIPIPVKGYTERLNNALGAERAGCGVVLDPQFFSRDVAKIALEKVRTRYVRENTAIFSKAAHAMQGHLKAAELIEGLEKSGKRSIKIL